MHTLPNVHQDYHAHFYFDATSSQFARKLQDTITNELGLPVGNFNQALVGPHLQWSFEVAFTHRQFEMLVDWLALNRNGHSVLIHAVTANDLIDHTEYAHWLGDAIPLNLSIFN